jgi:hypothetical protein
MAENDFQYWDEGAPVVTIAADPNFGGWLDGAPVLDGLGSSSGPTSTRRRTAFIF